MNKEYLIELYDSLIVSIFYEKPIALNNLEDFYKIKDDLRNDEFIVTNSINKKPAKTLREAIDIVKTYIKKNNWKYRQKKSFFQRPNGKLGTLISFTIYKREDS